MQKHFYVASLLLSISSLFFTLTVYAAPHGWVWEQITVGKDDNLTQIFLRKGLTEQDVYRITHTDPTPDALLNLKPGQKIQLALDHDTGNTPTLQGLRLIVDGTQSLEVIMVGTGAISNTMPVDTIIEAPTINTPPPVATPSPPPPLTDDPALVTVPTAQDIALGLVWKHAIVEKDDNLTRLFLREGLTAQDVYRVTQAKPKPDGLFTLIPGQTIQLALHDTDSGALALQEVRLEIDVVHTLSVTASESGFVSNMLTRDIEYREHEAQATITQSLFSAGKKANLSDNIIMQLAGLFNWDVDFALDIRENDSFSLIYKQGYVDGKPLNDVIILAAEFINQGHVYRAIRYTNAKDESSYFTPKGESMRKAFIRTPIDFARISSHFNLKRRHPVLNKIRAHKGVDYAAGRGTPIKATGRATIQFIGTQRGYGRTIILKHAGSYTTLYAHMKGFAKGLRKGSRVKQGQTIGYVGSSGLATGPHLHYEFRINGVHRNPLTVKLPRSVPLEKQYQADFKIKAQELTAKLDAISQHRVAQGQAE